MKLVVANWKMNHTASEARTYVGVLSKELEDLEHVEVVLAPPFTALAASAAVDGRWGLAGQNCHHRASGAFTGEVSARMLADLGCRYVILGHSERRRDFGEGGALLSEKVARAREAGLVPIFCVGESFEEREAGRTEEVLERQIGDLAGDPAGEPLVVAYEPVWAIGTGRSAGGSQIRQGHDRLRSLLSHRNDVRILYGGSVTDETSGEIVRLDGVDGALVGGASLDPAGFARIARAAEGRGPFRLRI
jgi:triosephosphate isomerase (TIM)